MIEVNFDGVLYQILLWKIGRQKGVLVILWNLLDCFKIYIIFLYWLKSFLRLFRLSLLYWLFIEFSFFHGLWRILLLLLFYARLQIFISLHIVIILIQLLRVRVRIIVAVVIIGVIVALIVVRIVVVTLIIILISIFVHRHRVPRKLIYIDLCTRIFHFFECFYQAVNIILVKVHEPWLFYIENFLHFRAHIMKRSLEICLSFFVYLLFNWVGYTKVTHHILPKRWRI